MTQFKPRSTFGAAPGAIPTADAAASSTPTGNARKEVGAIWENQSKTTGENFYKVQMNIPKELVEEALAKSQNGVVNFGFISFPNKSHNGENSRPKFRIFEDKKR